MKRLYLFARIGMLLTVIIWFVHFAIVTMPDWAVRTNGIAMLILMGLNSFCAVRLWRDRKEKE
ncbi:MAG: hypothetical protein IJ335_12020 [Lachnospiraceae bacterium]|nr:hypothetical protein [Lachnospiraceae bacterium]